MREAFRGAQAGRKPSEWLFEGEQRGQRKKKKAGQRGSDDLAP